MVGDPEFEGFAQFGSPGRVIEKEMLEFEEVLAFPDRAMSFAGGDRIAEESVRYGQPDPSRFEKIRGFRVGDAGFRGPSNKLIRKLGSVVFPVLESLEQGTDVKFGIVAIEDRFIESIELSDRIDSPEWRTDAPRRVGSKEAIEVVPPFESVPKEVGISRQIFK